MIWKYLVPSQLSNSIRRSGVLNMQREILLQNLYNITLGIITAGLAAVLAITLFMDNARQIFPSGHEAFYIIGYFVFAFFAVDRRLAYNVRAAFIVLIFQALGASALVSFGLSGTGITFIFASILLANLLFRRGAALVFDLLGLLVVGGVGELMLKGLIPTPPTSVQANTGDPVQWFLAGLVLVFASGVLTRSVFLILRGMNSAVLNSEKLASDLEGQQASLEQRVSERSTDLTKRFEQFEIASQIAREISGETDLEGLLNNAVNLIRDRFGFYHVGVFINDETGEYTVLRAATGKAGQAMLERFHRLKIGETGIVGFVAGRGEARIALNVQEDMVHYKNPNLPDTRSEMALPLRLGERTIGALDVQSVLPGAFAEEDARILQTIADQLAIAFEKSGLMAQLKQSLAELEKTDSSATQKAWRDHLRANHQKIAYRYHDGRLEPQAASSEPAREAQARGETVVQSTMVVQSSTVVQSGAAGSPSTLVAVPIRLRNQVLGVVDIRFERAGVSPDLIALIEGTVSRLAVSLENARLVEEIQYRAERDRVVSDISSKVRSAADVDSVLRVAIQEIGKSLGVSEVMVQLRDDR